MQIASPISWVKGSEGMIEEVCCSRPPRGKYIVCFGTAEIYVSDRTSCILELGTIWQQLEASLDDIVITAGMSRALLSISKYMQKRRAFQAGFILS